MKKIIVLLSLFITACNSAYKISESPDNAQIRFYIPDAQMGQSLNIYSHKDGKCAGAEKIHALGKPFNVGGVSETDRNMFRDKDSVYTAKNYVEIATPSNISFMFTLAGSYYMGTCFITMSFTPEPKKQYEASFQVVKDTCYGTVENIELVKNQFIRKPVESVEQKPKSCTGFWN